MTRQAISRDPVIDEIHTIRRELLQEAGGTLEGLGATLMSQQAHYLDRLVNDRQIPLPDLSVLDRMEPTA